MGAFWRAVGRTLFWSYERGSWPYDVMVLAILAFVLLTPRSWFHDRPKPGAVAGSSVALLSQDSAGQTRTYRLDARALPPDKRAANPSPELERETHDILSRAVPELQGRTFEVLRISTVQDSSGSVLYYDVTIYP